jgi:hypothetical protein
LVTQFLRDQVWKFQSLKHVDAQVETSWELLRNLSFSQTSEKKRNILTIREKLVFHQVLDLFKVLDLDEHFEKQVLDAEVD